ncbi:MAG: hypothetical protein IT406_04195 [Candidatus Yanofskybacteria bacterium]|nr:hypothetical protein [Candidatus Yanofskybacteria bacterium]
MDPYVGITDFMSGDQVRDMLAVFERSLPEASRRILHVGVMMSRKTLHDIPTRWAAAFPPKERIASIFCSDRTLNCIHYADSEKSDDLTRSLVRAIGYGGIGMHALQLDLVWPEPSEIANAVHLSRANIEVILQIGANALAAVRDDPRRLVGKLAEYRGIIHRVLLDKSMGRGIGMDAPKLIPFARAIREHFPELGIGAAGGLGPNTMHLAAPLIAEFPDISIDAQGRLRPSGSALDPVDWTMAAEYLRQALTLLS